jgi:hypothetical protein
VDANTGFALFQQSPVFAQAFADVLTDRKFLKEAAIDFVRRAKVDSLWQKYQGRGKFGSREEFEDGLREFRSIALATEVEGTIDSAWVSDAGGYQQMLNDVDALQLDPIARADLEALLLAMEAAKDAGQPLEAQLQEALQEQPT